MIFRLSQKLNVKIKAGTLPALPLDKNPFLDWSAHLFVANRTQHILLTNTRSLYSLVMYGKGVTDEGAFIERTLGSLREFMQADGQEFIFRRLIAPTSGTVRFAKALDRSVIGSMNELVKFAAFYLTEDQMSPFDASFKLNEIPMSSIARSDRGTYGMPRAAFKKMVSGSES